MTEATVTRARSLDDPCPYTAGDAPGAHDIISTIERDSDVSLQRVSWLYCRRCGATKHLGPPGYIADMTVIDYLREQGLDTNVFWTWLIQQRNRARP